MTATESAIVDVVVAESAHLVTHALQRAHGDVGDALTALLGATVLGMGQCDGAIPLYESAIEAFRRAIEHVRKQPGGAG